MLDDLRRRQFITHSAVQQRRGRSQRVRSRRCR